MPKKITIFVGPVWLDKKGKIRACPYRLKNCFLAKKHWKKLQNNEENIVTFMSGPLSAFRRFMSGCQKMEKTIQRQKRKLLSKHALSA